MYTCARAFDAETGEFTSPDPLEYVDGMSRFRGYFVQWGYDPEGTIGQIAGGALIGCAASAGYQAVYSLLTGDGFCHGCCKSGVSCLFGALGGAIAAIAPTYAGCIHGVISGVTGSVVAQICNRVCGSIEKTNITCAVITAILNGSLGCLIQAKARETKDPSGLTQKFTKWLWTVVSRITGRDMWMLCNEAIPPGPPFNPQNSGLKRCKKRCSSRCTGF